MLTPEVGKKIIVSVPSTSANIGPGFDCLGAALDLYNEFSFQGCSKGLGKRKYFTIRIRS